jgi:putative NADH-flavin reductase
MTLVLLFLSYAIVLSVALARAGHRGQALHRSRTEGREPTRVLIVGATGGTGRELVAQALERGLAVTALVRDPSRLRVEHPKLTVVQGDVLDAASVDAAVRGQDAVLSALGHRRYFYPTRILSAGTRNVTRAMDAHGVRRLVCETALGLGDSAGRLGLMYTLFVIPAILPFYFWDKTRQERAIAESRLDWVIVRPGALTKGERRGRVKEGRGAGSFLWTVRVSRADVAAFMLNQLASDTYLGTAPGVCW